MITVFHLITVFACSIGFSLFCVWLVIRDYRSDIRTHEQLIENLEKRIKRLEDE